MEYTVNQTTLSYHPAGDKLWGKDEILLDQAHDLTEKTAWHASGLTIEPLFPSKDYQELVTGIHSLLKKCWQDAGISIPENFQLDQYHTKIENQKSHFAAIEKTKLLPVELFPLPIDVLEKRISDICKVPLRVKNPFDGQSVFHFRVIRPDSNDNNPLHRDVWLEDYKDCINLYIPVAGSNIHSSLIILPGSHRWPESRVERTVGGAVINGIKFNVPAVTAIEGKYDVIRPDPKENEVLIFSPYLIHGGSVNLHHDRTRISIEMRLWKK